MSSKLDKKLDYSLDELIKQAHHSKAPVAPKTAPKATAASGRLAPKVLAKATSGVRAKRQGAAPAAAAAPQQGRVPKVLSVRTGDLKRRRAPINTVAPGTTVGNVRRTLAKKILNKAVMSVKPAAAAPRQRTAAAPTRQRAAAAQQVARGRQAAQQMAPKRLKQAITYTGAAPVALAPKILSTRQANPASMSKRMRQQRQERQAAPPPQAPPAGRRKSAPKIVGQKPQQPRYELLQYPQQQYQAQQYQQPAQQQPRQRTAPRMLPAPRQQQQREMLGRVQQGGTRKARAAPPPLQQQQRAPVYVPGAPATKGRPYQRYELVYPAEPPAYPQPSYQEAYPQQAYQEVYPQQAYQEAYTQQAYPQQQAPPQQRGRGGRRGGGRPLPQQQAPRAPVIMPTGMTNGGGSGQGRRGSGRRNRR